jgi:hypothetical protein
MSLVSAVATAKWHGTKCLRRAVVVVVPIPPLTSVASKAASRVAMKFDTVDAYKNLSDYHHFGSYRFTAFATYPYPTLSVFERNWEDCIQFSAPAGILKNAYLL